MSLAFAASTASGQQTPTAPLIDQLMNAEQLRASGLNKLSAAEMAALNTWLQRYTEAVFQFALSGQAAATSRTQAVVESRIDGEFTGWEGETIFKLVNGQIWQQSSYAYKYVYKYSPKVLIYKSGVGYKMQVEGVDGTISVTRLK
jgi:hypothetical protein